MNDCSVDFVIHMPSVKSVVCFCLHVICFPKQRVPMNMQIPMPHNLKVFSFRCTKMFFRTVRHNLKQGRNYRIFPGSSLCFFILTLLNGQVCFCILMSRMYEGSWNLTWLCRKFENFLSVFHVGVNSAAEPPTQC